MNEDITSFLIIFNSSYKHYKLYTKITVSLVTIIQFTVLMCILFYPPRKIMATTNNDIISFMLLVL